MTVQEVKQKAQIIALFQSRIMEESRFSLGLTQGNGE
jgi:hypothetical protein